MLKRVVKMARTLSSRETSDNRKQRRSNHNYTNSEQRNMEDNNLNLEKIVHNRRYPDEPREEEVKKLKNINLQQTQQIKQLLNIMKTLSGLIGSKTVYPEGTEVEVNHHHHGRFRGRILKVNTGGNPNMGAGYVISTPHIHPKGKTTISLDTPMTPVQKKAIHKVNAVMRSHLTRTGEFTPEQYERAYTTDRPTDVQDEMDTREEALKATGRSPEEARAIKRRVVMEKYGS